MHNPALRNHGSPVLCTCILRFVASVLLGAGISPYAPSAHSARTSSNLTPSEQAYIDRLPRSDGYVATLLRLCPYFRGQFTTDDICWCESMDHSQVRELVGAGSRRGLGDCGRKRPTCARDTCWGFPSTPHLLFLCPVVVVAVTPCVSRTLPCVSSASVVGLLPAQLGVERRIERAECC